MISNFMLHADNFFMAEKPLKTHIVQIERKKLVIYVLLLRYSLHCIAPT